MVTKTFFRSELKQRLILKQNSLFIDSGVFDIQSVSFDWLKQLDSGLDKAENNVKKICSAFSTAISDSSYLETIKWELSRIPISFKFSKYIQQGTGNKVVTIKNEKDSFAVGSEDCPTDVFLKGTSYAYNEVKRGDPVWCYYPVTLAQEKGYELVKTWTEKDALVDWLTDYLNIEDKEASIRIENLWDTEDTRYTLYFPSKTKMDNLDTLQQDLSPIEHIYHFIRQNAPVRTHKILDQKFAQRMQVFRYLKKLERDNRIEKVRHGVYIPI